MLGHSLHSLYFQIYLIEETIKNCIIFYKIIFENAKDKTKSCTMKNIILFIVCERIYFPCRVHLNLAQCSFDFCEQFPRDMQPLP